MRGLYSFSPGAELLEIAFVLTRPPAGAILEEYATSRDPSGGPPGDRPWLSIVTLREALLAAGRPAVGPEYRLSLCCGFEPLHLTAFLKARIRERLTPAGRGATIGTGRFGDLAGNIERALAVEDGAPLAVVLDWPDLDPRLGLREAHRPAADDETSILAEAAARLARLETLLTAAAAGRRIALSLPAGPLPPWTPGLPGQATAFVLRLQDRLAALASACAAAGVRVAAPVEGDPRDFRSFLRTGFPYSLPFADALAARLTALLLPPVPKKGLITDLDNTLWMGIVGDDGPGNVHWSIDRRARAHGIYQQFLGALAAQGVLVGVASKNDPEPVAEALGRTDLLLNADALFPVMTGWGHKSASIRRIAETWNIGLDDIVFVDDSPLELAAVRQELPGVECVLFPSGDPVALLETLQTIARQFARESTGEEDRLRAASLRAGAGLSAGAAHSGPEALLAGLQARLVFDFRREPFDPRALELLNKTNQFNLNGRRWEESDFRRFLASPDALLCVVHYEDRFGPLGKSAVVAGRREGAALRLESWAMSCRAFSRRIEFATLQALYNDSGARTILLDWTATPRNGPVRETLELLLGPISDAGLLPLDRELFTARCPRLYDGVTGLPLPRPWEDL